MEKYYNLRAAAQLLDVPVRTIRQWIREKKIKAIQYMPRGKWYIPEKELNRIRSGKKD